MTSNPTLNAKTFSQLPAVTGATMTVQGAVNKTALLLGLVILTAAFSWNSGEAAGGWLMIGSIAGFVIGLITCFKATWSPVTAPMYALCEGLVLGGLSYILNRSYPGIAFQAVLLTFGVTAALLSAYTMRLIQATDKFKRGIFIATAGIAFYYLISIILGFFHIATPGFGNSLFSIGLSVVIVIIAALNLIVDFDVIEKGAAYGAPKYMEWYSAFGLLVTLVWLYVEILRLLAKLNSRRN